MRIGIVLGLLALSAVFGARACAETVGPAGKSVVAETQAGVGRLQA